MIDIYCTGGTYLDVDIDFHVMMHLLRDGIIKDDDFVEFAFADGGKGAVRKSYINGICESFEEA